MNVDGLPPLKPLPTPVGAFERAYRDGRRRRARKLLLLSAGGAGTLAAAAIAVAGTGSQAGGRATLVPASPSATTPSPSASVKPRFTGQPAWLPPGAHFVQEWRRGGALVRNYGLPGPANADNIPFGGATEQNATHIHQATYIEITSVPEKDVVPYTPLGLGPYQQAETVSGHPAVLSTTWNPKSPGPGDSFVSWIANGTRWTVQCERLHTDDGLSGVDTADLLHVAESLGT